MEIIVVLIIIGVLACIALPSLFNWINRSKAYEAINKLGYLKMNLELCLQGASSSCTALQEDIKNNNSKDWIFTYGKNYNSLSTDVNLDGLVATAQFASGTVQLKKTNTIAGTLEAYTYSSKYECIGTGIFQGVC